MQRMNKTCTFSTNKPSTDDIEFLTVSEVADILRVDDTTVRRWIKAGALEAVVLPHVNSRQAYRIKKKTLDALTIAQLISAETTTTTQTTQLTPA